jgi:predicted ATPase
MAKAYVSSTFFDLREYRERVRSVLRHLGHDDMAMEYYVAEERRPVDRSLADVAACDFFICIIAWRYGWIPLFDNPDELSIIEMEYLRAKQLGKPCLMFMLDENAPWPVKFVDADPRNIRDFRDDVTSQEVVALFTSPDQLALSLTQAIQSSVQLAGTVDGESRPQDRGNEQSGLPSPPDDLIGSLAKSECVLYAGAGLSAEANLPTWSLFISDLLQWAREKSYIKGDFADSLKEAIEFGQTDLVADSLINSIGSDQNTLNSYLKKVFLSTPNLPDRYSLLREIPFSAVLSANFDDLLERNYRHVVENRIYTPQDWNELLAALSKNVFYILKLYGMLERPESVLVAPAQYQAAIAQNLLFSQFMDSLFVSKTLLFIGASLDGIAAYLNGLKFQGTSTPRRHYALVDVTGSAWKVNADLLQRRYGISVLPYSASPGYPEVSIFLEQVIDKLRGQKAATGKSVSTGDEAPRAGAWLRRLKLENVGPFDQQEFELNRGWNVLFGDNGVGKSSVLKAIAVALCGQDARPYAEQLIKSGRSSATITLDVASKVDGKVEERRYITQLHRTRTGAEVESIPVRALEVENLLSLGFPPLRAMSEAKSTDGGTGGSGGPDPADLVPLISGAPDNRLDKLKNWILDLDHLSKDTADEVERTRLTRALLDFFEVIKELTPGVDLEFASIDVARKRVMVTTQDGVIPIDYVSQGTSSLLGWIGVLWRRLFDMGGKELRMQEKHALVLIDEIDAHMHPKWQQTLPVDIRRLFPSLQVIATTHSPLIVPSLESGEVFSITRSSATNKLGVEKITENFRGYRADQILTSRLFSLVTSRDKQTYEELMEYTQLAVETNLDQAQQDRLKELTAKLNVRVPLPWEREEARQTYELIKDALTQKIEEMDFDSRGRILDEVKAQLLEIDQDAGRLS